MKKRLKHNKLARELPFENSNEASKHSRGNWLIFRQMKEEFQTF